MSKVEEKLREYADKLNICNKYLNGEWACKVEKITDIKKNKEICKEIIADLKEIQTEQEELQKKADAYDEQSKPVEVPAYVAKWIEDYRKNYPHLSDPNFGLIAHLDDYFTLRNGEPDDLDKGYKEYMDNHCIDFIKAWLDGYTVEQEQPFKIGEYYKGPSDDILKINSIENETAYVTFANAGRGNLLDSQFDIERDGEHYTPATIDEIALFKRAEHFHSKGRKLNEIQPGDLIEHNSQLNIVGPDVSYGYVRVDVRGNTHSIGEMKEVKLIMTAEELEAKAQEVEG